MLPSTYRGSPRDNVQRYADSMAIVRAISKPHIFMTVTTNPKWAEIQSSLPPGRAAHHCPWICVRVFKQKFDLLLNDILKKDVFGKANFCMLISRARTRSFSCLQHVHAWHRFLGTRTS